MGWVTLTLRKKELKVSHAYYQLRDLQISREKRAMARQKQANSTSVNNNKRVELKAQLEQWESDKQQVYEDAASNQQTTGNGTNGTNTNGTNANGTNTNTTANTYTLSSTDLQKLNDYQAQYEAAKEEINSRYDDELAMVEEEAADREAELDLEQTDVESQMEAISQEMSAVSDAISSEIQNSTIKLS